MACGIVDSLSCEQHNQQLVKIYLEEYYTILDSMIGGYHNCGDCLKIGTADSAKMMARMILQNECIDSSIQFVDYHYYELYELLWDYLGDDADAFAAWLSFNNSAAPGPIYLPKCH